MAIIIDLILVAIIVAVCVNSYVKGLVVSVFNVVSSLLAIAVSFVFYPIVSGWLAQTPVFDWIQRPVEASLLEKGVELTEVTAENLIAQLQLPEVVSQNILDTVGEITGTLPEIAKAVSIAVVTFLLQVICMVILFVIVKIGLLFLKDLLKNVTNLPILKQVDKLGGLLFGVVESFVLLTVIGALLSLFSGSVDSGFLSAVDSTHIGSFFYNHNLLIVWLSNQM